VHRHRVLVRKRRVAPRTRFQLRLRVRRQVFCPRRLGDERSAARLTLVRLVARVPPTVRLQHAFGGERLAARVALVRFFTRVCPLVHPQRIVRGIRFAARLADVIPIVAHVDRNVFHQTTLSCKRLIAPVALKTWAVFLAVLPGGVHCHRTRPATIIISLESEFMCNKKCQNMPYNM